MLDPSSTSPRKAGLRAGVCPALLNPLLSGFGDVSWWPLLSSGWPRRCILSRHSLVLQTLSLPSFVKQNDGLRQGWHAVGRLSEQFTRPGWWSPHSVPETSVSHSSSEFCAGGGGGGESFRITKHEFF